jgi:hypothetical protein
MMVAILGVLPRRSGEGEKYGTTYGFSMGRVFGMRICFRADIGNDLVGVPGWNHACLHRESGKG